jgi:uncharacterized membrane protein
VTLPQATVQEVKGRGAAALWSGVLVPPVTFGVDLLLSYALVQHACSTGHFYVMHAITVVAVLIALSAGFLSWREYTRIPKADDEGGSPFDRAQFMAIYGMASALGFTIAIIAVAVPRFILSPCD